MYRGAARSRDDCSRFLIQRTLHSPTTATIVHTEKSPTRASSLRLSLCLVSSSMADLVVAGISGSHIQSEIPEGLQGGIWEHYKEVAKEEGVIFDEKSTTSMIGVLTFVRVLHSGSLCRPTQ